MKLVIFDCDGTLADSQHMIVEAMNEAFRMASLPSPPREDVVRVIGLSLEQAVQNLLPQDLWGRAGQISDDYKHAFHGLRASGLKHEPLFPGMREAVLALAGEGVHLGIATGKSLRGVRVLLEREGLMEQFVTIQTADMHPSKPNPSMIEAAMIETGARLDETVMIGDTSFDMLMAMNAGVAGIGVSWGYHPVPVLHDAGARVVADNATEMLAAIDGLLRTAERTAL